MARKRDFSLSAERFSLAWWLSGARNVFWVAVITLLIWVYADLEMSEPREFPATLELTIGGAGETVLRSGSITMVTFKAEGSRRALAQFEQWLLANDRVIEFDVSSFEPGDRELLTVDVLNRVPQIVQYGLEVQSATPHSLKFQVDRVEFTATLQLTVGDDADMVVLGGSGTSVTFGVKGNQPGITQFEQWLTNNDAVIEIDVSGYEPEDYSVQVVQMLNQVPAIVDRHLEVYTAVPSTLQFQVDRLLSRPEVRVVFDYDGAMLAGDAEIDPPTVTVTAAASDWERIGLASEELEIRTAYQDLSMVPPGDEERRLTLVASIGDVPVQLSPQTVTVKFQVVQPTDTRTISVPIRILSPVEWATDGTWVEYVLQKKHTDIPWRVEITVTGPKDDLRELRPEDVHAFIVLKDSDKEALESWLERTVQVQLPAHLQLRVVGEMPSFEFKLVRREE